MSNEFKRIDRVAEMMQRKLSQIIQQEIKDPRLPAFITISSVKVTADLGHAKVYFTALNADKEKTASILNSAASYLRTALARSVKLRTVPQLHFVYDESIEYGRRLSRLIDDLNSPDNKDDQS
ncbi:30S ribosome-binding factor RbfA [Legionella micdadei]|uniref:Ribosome-binding factor A n=1 Tax=Legionella micdadei TaxID=451 RepID=A0A098GAU7_LEGMI|nr:30S ribosome-binding factor RbfA [Legionella micdadei]ARG96409.1 ribosome-binding factor A [Legionella micdadei]ARG99158.1 ribosome-binding factor A [Legionella micdadei]KTD29504.1 ribosome-binding factor A [Legionella micdadei]NSL18098.1 30S ribosome-binding factor RbfA [Legionella micdadei]CEG59614.1 Ribosome-binding factor A [Legionella micdadei]